MAVRDFALIFSVLAILPSTTFASAMTCEDLVGKVGRVARALPPEGPSQPAELFLVETLRNYARSNSAPVRESKFGKTIEAHSQMSASRDQVVEGAISHLKQNGVAFEIISSGYYKGDRSPPPAAYLSALRILPSARPDAHPLNRLADGLQTVFGIKLVFDFSYMKKLGFNGGFSNAKKVIYISTEMIDLLGVDGTFVHELEHAYFHFLRESGKRDNVYNVIAKSLTREDQQVVGYDGYMNFEELLNHPISVRLAAWELTAAAKSTTQLFAEKRANLSDRVGTLLKVLRIAKQGLQENKDSLQAGQATARLAQNGKSIVVITNSKMSLPLTVSFFEPSLIARFRQEGSKVQREVLEKTADTLEKLQQLVLDQEKILEGMKDIKTLEVSQVDRIEKVAKALLQRALSELKSNDRETLPAESGNKTEVDKSSSTPQTGRDMVRRQEGEFDRLLSTSGFSGIETLRQAVDEAASKDRNFKQIRDVIRDQQVELIMYRNSRSREALRKNGFLNSHQSGRSGGDLNPERRNTSETSYLAMSLAEYRNVEDAAKPKYFLIRYPWEKEHASMGYGDDLYIFSPEKMSERITFTIGDSLDKTPQITGSNDIKAWKPKVWDQMFVPWKYRDLMLLELLPGFRHSQSLMVPTVSTLAKLRQFFATVGFSSFSNYKKSVEGNQTTYVEVQGFGEFNFADVVGFQFNTSPPSGPFLRELLEQKVIIYDGRSGQRVEWKPSQSELARLLKDTAKGPQGTVPKLGRDDLRFEPEDRVRVKWMQGSQEQRSLGWAERLYQKGGRDFLEISQTYKGDEHITVSIPVEDIVEFKNLNR